MHASNLLHDLGDRLALAFSDVSDGGDAYKEYCAQIATTWVLDGQECDSLLLLSDPKRDDWHSSIMNLRKHLGIHSYSRSSAAEILFCCMVNSKILRSTDEDWAWPICTALLNDFSQEGLSFIKKAMDSKGGVSDVKSIRWSVLKNTSLNCSTGDEVGMRINWQQGGWWDNDFATWNFSVGFSLIISGLARFK